MTKTKETGKYGEDYIAAICLVTLSFMGTAQARNVS